MAIFKISEAQKRLLNKFLFEDSNTNNGVVSLSNDATLNTNVKMGPDDTAVIGPDASKNGELQNNPKATVIDTKELEKNGSNVEVTNKNNNSNSTTKPLENSGRIITKAKLSENRRKALNAKSKVYSFNDFIRK